MSTRQPAASDAAIQEWKNKLAALQEAEALIPMNDVEGRRLNAKQQAEAKRKIAELEASAPTHPTGPRRSLRDKTQISAGGTLTLASLLAAIAQITGHLKEIVENVPFVRSLSPIYIGAGLAILLLTGLVLLWRGFSARRRSPDPRCLVLDPEQNPNQFVGRKADLQSLAKCLDEGDLVFLSGESGSGKSVLINVGLRDFLQYHRPDLRLLPIVVDSYGASEDWDADLSARLASKFFDSLTPEERDKLGFSERKRTTRQLMELLRVCDSKVGRIPLLIFDQFDDYQTVHREQFLLERKWITPETLVAENRFWKAIQEALEKRAFKVLLVTRRDRFDSLDSLRLVWPVPYPLPNLASNEIRGVLVDLFASAGLTDADSMALQNCVLDDLTDELGEILPIQAALAIQGLAHLEYLTPRQYRRKGGLRGLQVVHVRRGLLHFGQSLRIDRRAACAFFRRMVDHGSPPKTLAVASSALAEQVKRKEPQVLDSLRALSKPALRIVRERIEATDTQGSEWSLYHDFLAPIALEVQRKLDSANALLEQKHAAIRSANSWWAWWTALLSPWESLRLTWAALQRRVRMAGHWRYWLVSTLRFLPYAALAGALWFGGVAYREQVARSEAQSVVAAVKAVRDLSEPPAGGELRQIENLARARWLVKEQFIRALLRSPMTTDRFALREAYLTHAIVGIDPSHQARERFLDILATAPLGTKPDSLATRGFWRARIFASDPTRYAPLASLASSDLAEAMRATADPDQLGYLADGLAVLAEKIDPKPGLPFAQKLIEAMRATTNALVLGYLADGLTDLVEKIDPKLCAPLAEKIVEAMRCTTDPDQLGYLADGLAVLAEKIDPKLCVRGAEYIVETMRATTDPDQLSHLAKGLAVLAEKIDPKLCVQGAEHIVETILAPTDSYLLAEGLAVLVEKIGPTSSVPLAEQIVEAMQATTDHDQLHYLAEGLAVLAEKIDPKPYVQGAEKIVEVMTTNPFVSLDLAAGLTDLAEKIDPKLCAQGAEKIVEAMQATTDADQLRYLSERLAVLAEKIDPKLCAPLAEKIVEAMRATTDPERLRYLAAGLAGLAEKIDPKLCVQGAEQIAEAMRATTDSRRLRHFAAGLAVLAKKVDPKLCVQGAEQLIVAMQAGTNAFVLNDLAGGLTVLAEKIDRKLWDPLAERIVGAMRATKNAYPLGYFAAELAVLAEKIDPKVCVQGAERIVEAMQATTNPDQLGYLAEGLAVLVKTIDPKLCAPLAEKIVEAIRATTDFDQLRCLAFALFDSKYFESADNPQVLVELLKHPLAMAPSQPAPTNSVPIPRVKRVGQTLMDVLLAYLGRGLQKGPFPDLRSFVVWAETHAEVKLDLESPPELRLSNSP